jgi:hypothetical protein
MPESNHKSRPLTHTNCECTIQSVADGTYAAGSDRGRDDRCRPPPAQIRTCPIQASGSCRRCLTRKRCSDHG